MELIRRKLIKAAFILRSNEDVGRSFQRDIVDLAKQAPNADLHEILEMLQRYSCSLERHERVIQSLLDRSAGTGKLVRKHYYFRLS
jgi:hypothetical protein